MEATASLTSQFWLCSLMIYFSNADSSHLPLSGTVAITAISSQKETELLAFLCLFPRNSLRAQLLSGFHTAWGVCVCVCVSLNITDCQYHPASQPHGAKQNHCHGRHVCAACEVNTPFTRGQRSVIYKQAICFCHVISFVIMPCFIATSLSSASGDLSRWKAGYDVERVNNGTYECIFKIMCLYS